jgi:hypothetical protein
MSTMIDIEHTLASLTPAAKVLHRQWRTRDLAAVFPGIDVIPRTSDEGPCYCRCSDSNMGFGAWPAACVD